MINRAIFQRDPSAEKLVNEGVASVNDEQTPEALKVLRYELVTFVCDGQYEKGIGHILETYLKNMNQSQQPAVWISGFYGSGKSHLVKMLRALWVDTQLDDGSTARNTATLPQNISDLLKELTAEAKRHGYLHAASGTLGSGASGSVRLALLRIIFKSVGLPEQYHVARFVMWLQSEEIYDQVRKKVEEEGNNWQEELDNFYVAEGLFKALVSTKPTLFSSTETCAQILLNLYPHVSDISSDEMVKAIRQALTKNGKFPLMLVVLDEVQQYIGEDSQRSMDVQEAVEACCKNIGGKLLFIGTGQTAVTGTSNLKKLEGRFTIRIELSDADVDAVIRKVILAKKPTAITAIEDAMQTNLGEVSRHLSGTTIEHRQDDIRYFAQDYPILPVRRRFWENSLRVLDQTGTDSQLRNQLSMIHKAIQTNLEENLGSVIPADYLYFDSADKLIQSRILPRKVHEQTMKWNQGSEDERLKARATGLVFLINKLSASNTDIGIKATVDYIADLMVDDLPRGSSSLRSKLPGLLDKCELLMKVRDEYRIQTEESAAWNDEFLSERNNLASQAHRVDTERDDRIKRRFNELVSKRSFTHGNSKVTREVYPTFESQQPSDSNQKIYVWVRDGWSIDENSVQAEARQAGNQSPVIFVFIPKRSADDLRHYLIDYKAAEATLQKRGVPNTPEGAEARSAMVTTQQTAEGKIRELLDEAFSGAKVFQAGGTEILGNNLQDMVMEAAKNSLSRLYPKFDVADHMGWDKVYALAAKGAPAALKAVGYDGEIAKNPVCKEIINFIVGGKKGIDIRNFFEGANFGWSRDAVDGALQVLLNANVLKALDERNQTITPMEFDRKNIGKTTFKIESVTITTLQRLEIRKLFQKLFQKIGYHASSSDELTSAPQFIEKMLELAKCAGGEPPKPAPVDISFLEEIRLTPGNEQLLAIYKRRDELDKAIDDWKTLAESIEKRLPPWLDLQDVLKQAGEDIKAAQEASQQAKAIEQQRLLLREPDPIQPLLKSLEDALRIALNELDEKYKQQHEAGMQRLRADSNWQQLEPEQKNHLLAEQKLSDVSRPRINVKSFKDIVESLQQTSLSMFNEKLAAMNGRFDTVLEQATELMEPKVQFIYLPRPFLKTETDIENWLQETRQLLKSALNKGPISIR